MQYVIISKKTVQASPKESLKQIPSLSLLFIASSILEYSNIEG